MVSGPVVKGGGDPRHSLTRLWRFARPHRAVLLTGLLCAVVVAALTAIYGLLAKEVVDAIGQKDAHRLNALGVGILGVFAVRALFLFAQNFLTADAMQKTTRDLRNAVYSHIQVLPLRYFEDRSTGKLMSSITADVPVIQEAFQSGILESISGPVVAVGATALMLYMSWKMTVAVVLLVPLVVWLIRGAGIRMRRASAMIQERFQGISDLLQETIAGVRVVKSFTAESREAARFTAQSQEAHRAVMRSVRVRAILTPAVEFAGAMGFVVVLWLGGQLIARDQFTFGQMAGFLVAVNQLGAASKHISNVQLAFKRLEAACERIFALLDTKPDIVDKPGALKLGRLRGEVTFDHVSFRYGEGPEVLRDVSFRIEPGQVCAIVGPSGAGKSTIAALLPRFYDVSAGSIRVDGFDVRDVTLASLRAQIGIVPQETVLFSGTVADNIRYGKPDATEAEVRWAAEAAHADAFISELPEGYDTRVGERGAKLSGGQRQRIAIARALLRNPRILILDEATSALDTESESLVQDALNKLMEGRTTLVIAHRLSTIRNAGHVLVFQAGALVEQGTHAELLASGGVFSRFHDLQYVTGDAEEKV